MDLDQMNTDRNLFNLQWLVSAIHQDQSAADDLIEQLSFDYLILVDAAQDVLTRRKILQHKVQKKRASKEITGNITEDVFDKEGC